LFENLELFATGVVRPPVPPIEGGKEEAKSRLRSISEKPFRGIVMNMPNTMIAEALYTQRQTANSAVKLCELPWKVASLNAGGRLEGEVGRAEMVHAFRWLIRKNDKGEWGIVDEVSKVGAALIFLGYHRQMGYWFW
tara:strand:- start:1476 stop:1886 length:411 start_codon:yes stop_codon:yes gene_type:complete